MTISSYIRKAGPYLGNGSTNTFPFAFKVFSAADVVVVRTDLDGAELVLTLGADYTVLLNANQDANPGGNVTVSATPATGYRITLTSSLENLQPVDLTNAGGFYPKVINSALDRLTILVQQLAEKVSRSVKVQISSDTTPDEVVAQLASAASLAANSAAAASASAGSASASATTATNKAAAASSSATSAAASAFNAESSSFVAGGSATTASAAATAAAGSATAAANSATSAANSAATATSAASGAVSLRSDLAASGAGKGADIVGVLPADTGGAVARTVQSKLRDFSSVKDYGAVGNGVADDFQAFAWAHSSTPAGRTIYVPPGTYKITSTVYCTGRSWFFEGATLTGAGKLNGGLVVYRDPSTGMTRHGVGNPYQWGAKYAFGGNHHGNTGLQIGGGDIKDGPEGNIFFADGYSGWTTIAPSMYPGAMEFAVQPGAIAGECTVTSGSNVVNRSFGGEFIPSLVGRRLYLGNGRIYIVASYTDASHVVLKNLDGSAVSFPASETLTYVVVHCHGFGICNTNGATVTRVSGDPFIRLGMGDDRIIINGVSYATTGMIPDQDTMILTGSAGVQTGVAYEYWTTVDNLSSAMRVHRVSGAGFEENITIGAYADGYFHIQAAGGTARQYPLYIGSGYDARGKRKQITMDGASGSMLLGGDYDRPTLEIGYQSSPTNWLFFAAGSPGAYGPSAIPRGPDANIGFDLSPKGTGVITIAGVSHESDGKFSLGNRALRPLGSKGFINYGGGGSEYGLSFRPNTDNTTSLYFTNAAGGQVGAITQTASATAYGTSSDYRLKESVVPLTGGLDRLLGIKPCAWTWIDSGDQGEGFLAHELADHVPLAVTGEKDGERYQTVDYSKVVPVLVKAVQELAAKVSVLEGRG